jgi:hypothetical protein
MQLFVSTLLICLVAVSMLWAQTFVHRSLKKETAEGSLERLLEISEPSTYFNHSSLNSDNDNQRKLPVQECKLTFI